MEEITSSAHFSKLCDALKNSGTFHETCSEFNALSSNIERIEYVSKLKELKGIKIKLSSSSKKCNERVQNLLFPAYANFTNGDYTAALQRFNAIAISAPYVPVAEFVQKQCRLSFSKTVEGGRITKMCILVSQNPYHAGVADRAKTLSKMNRCELAIADLDHVLSFDNSDDSYEFYFFQKASFLQMNNCFDEAWEVYNDAKLKFADDKIRLNHFTYLLEESKRSHKKLCKKWIISKVEPRNCSDKASWKPVPEIKQANPSVPCASASVDINFEKDKGRSVIATADVDPGETIIVESPFAYCLLGSIKDYCYRCLMAIDIWYPCLGCRTVVYCSELCSLSDNIHSIECPIIGFLFNDLEDDREISAAIRVVLSAGIDNLRDLFEKKSVTVDTSHNSDFSGDGEYDLSSYSTILDLGKECPETWAMYIFSKAVHAYLITQILFRKTNFWKSTAGQNYSQEFLIFVASLVLNHALCMEYCALRISCTKTTHFHSKNNPNACGHRFLNIGKGVFAFSGLISHSCTPNAFAVFHGKDVVIRAVRPIAKGEKITLNKLMCHSYYDDVSERKQLLMKQYKFKCNCTACIENWSSYEQLPSFTAESIMKPPVERILQKLTLLATDSPEELCCGLEERIIKIADKIREVFRYEDDEQIIKDTVRCSLLLEAFSRRPNRAFGKVEEVIFVYFMFLGNRTVRCINSVKEWQEMQSQNSSDIPYDVSITPL